MGLRHGRSGSADRRGGGRAGCTSGPPATGDTVYVDVRCPNHIDGDTGGEIGVGVLLG